MKNYIGTKIIKAKLTTLDKFKIVKYGENAQINDGDDKIECYLVFYPAIGNSDSHPYMSMSPKDVFETCYRELQKEEVELINRVNSFFDEGNV